MTVGRGWLGGGGLQANFSAAEIIGSGLTAAASIGYHGLPQDVFPSTSRSPKVILR